MHRNGGAVIPVHVGPQPALEEGEDRVSRGYLARVEALPLLQSQGDGIKGFAGVLFATSVGAETVVLIDEPELFLHPPQAYFLGRALGAHTAERQLWIASHNSNFLRGLLESHSQRLKIIRLERTGNQNVPHLLGTAQLEELWSNPLLRYSNAFDGLFHDQVVICESDTDCRFYSAVLDSIPFVDGKKPDALFLPCGGKDRLNVIVSALVRLNVTVKVIADFDILSTDQVLKKVVESFGKDWSVLKRAWGILDNDMKSKKAEKSVEEIRDEIVAVLDQNAKSPNLPKKAREEILNSLKSSSPWGIAKRAGKSYIPSGQATQAYNELNKELKGIGIFIVEVGELESFVRSVGGHATDWVFSVLQKDLVNDQELSEARDFVKEIVTAQISNQ